MLAVAAFTNASGVVLVSDNHDDVFFQQVASGALLYANNSSFLNNGPGTFGAIPIPTSGAPSIFVTNGSAVDVQDIKPNNWPMRSEGNVDSADYVTTFPLSGSYVDEVNEGGLIDGTIEYAGATWRFRGTTGDVVLAGGTAATITRPTNVQFVDDPSGAAYVLVRWSGAPIPIPPSHGVPAVTITYDANPRGPEPIFNAEGKQVGFSRNLDLRTDRNRTVSSGRVTTFTVPVSLADPGGIIPGTMSGALSIGNAVVGFTLQDSASSGAVSVPLAFGVAASQSFVTIDGGSRSVSGEANLRTGEITLRFSSDIPGGVSLSSARYAVFNRDLLPNKVVLAPGLDVRARLQVDLLTRGSEVFVNSPLISPPQLELRASGVVFNARTESGSAVVIGPSLVSHDVYTKDATKADAAVSPDGKILAVAVRPGYGGQGYRVSDLPGSTLKVDVTLEGGGGKNAKAKATVENGVVTSIEVIDRGEGYSSVPRVSVSKAVEWPAPQPAATAERVAFNAQISADSYDISLALPATATGGERSSLLVSPSGSLAASITSTPTQPSLAATNLMAVIADGDVVVEGMVNASTQTWLLQSREDGQSRAPYFFTTRSRATGASTGMLQGRTVAVTLGNETITPPDGGVVENVLDLDARAESIRITAATKAGSVLSGPFPYKLALRSPGNLVVDAVAASGFPLVFASKQDIAISAAIQTAAGVSIEAGGAFAVLAPLTTERGRVEITAASVAVNNSLRVLDASSDESQTDIVLTATAGDLSLVGAVAAVNGVRLVQRNKLGVAGRVYGPSRLIARRVEVESEGSVSIQTDAQSLVGRARGDFLDDETDDISVDSLSAGGLVTLRAGGVDPGEDNPLTPNAVALSARLEDVTRLEVSAPRGSVDVVSNTSKLLVLGDVSGRPTAAYQGMQAAGAVRVRSSAGPLVVADAPVAGGSAVAVRVATNRDIAAIYNPGVSGFTAGTLIGSVGALVVDGVPLRAGDRVLVKDQQNPAENGVYTVTSNGSNSQKWVLTRSVDADTSAEVKDNTLVRVLAGSSAGRVFRIGFESAIGASKVLVGAVPNRADAFRVRVATTTRLSGNYDPVQQVITGSGSGLLVDGITVREGDFVLVKDQGGEANGVYQFAQLGGFWRLSRAVDPETGAKVGTGYVAANEGSRRAASTGSAFLVSYDALGLDAMGVFEVDGGAPSTNIGTEDINDTTTFVVSSTAGTNDAAGSLGKMLSLMQANDTSGSILNQSQKTSFAFASSLPGVNGAPAGVIRLTQELPAIAKAFAIDGAVRTQLPGASGPATRVIVVDGSRITTTRLGQSAAVVPEVNGFEFLPGASAAPSVAGASVANLTVGGFAKGAAVKVNGASGVMVNSVTLGRNESGDRLANRFGALVTGAGGELTVLNSRIAGSTEAGIRVEGAAMRATVVGSAIGAANQANRVGIDLAAGVSRIGLNPLPSKLPKATVTVGSSLMYFNAPAAVLNSLYVGQTLTGNGIPNGTVIAAIHGPWITMSKAGTNTLPTNVRFGLPTRNVIEHNLAGILMSGGANIVTNSDIGNNVYDGIKITGGTQYVGLSRKISAQSNQIYANGRAGVAVYGGGQIIVGNVFGARGANRGGNILVNDVTPPAYKPVNPRGGADRFGNHHAPVNSISGAKRVTWRG